MKIPPPNASSRMMTRSRISMRAPIVPLTGAEPYTAETSDVTASAGPAFGVTPECVSASADSLGQPDQNALGASDVAEAIHVFVLHHFVDELRALLAEPGERIVEVVHGEHDTQITQSVHRGVPVIGDHRRREKAREFDPAVAVRRTHHRGLDALIAQSSDAPRPVSFDHGSPFEFEAQLGEKRDSGIKRFHHDADVVDPLKRHPAILADPQRSPVSGSISGEMSVRLRIGNVTPNS